MRQNDVYAYKGKSQSLRRGLFVNKNGFPRAPAKPDSSVNEPDFSGGRWHFKQCILLFQMKAAFWKSVYRSICTSMHNKVITRACTFTPANADGGVFSGGKCRGLRGRVFISSKLPTSAPSSGTCSPPASDISMPICLFVYDVSHVPQFFFTFMDKYIMFTIRAHLHFYHFL